MGREGGGLGSATAGPVCRGIAPVDVIRKDAKIVQEMKIFERSGPDYDQ